MMDARQKKVLTVLCLGSAFLAWRGYVIVTEYVIPSKGSAETNVVPAYPPEEGLTTAAAVAAAVPAEVLRQQAAIAQQAWGRDPFAPVPEARLRPVVATPEQWRQAGPTPPAPSFRFTGVSQSGGRWLAVVGDRIVRVGDELDGGFTVTEISKRTLTLVSGRWAFQYELGVEAPMIGAFGEEP